MDMTVDESARTNATEIIPRLSTGSSTGHRVYVLVGEDAGTWLLEVEE